MKVRRYTPADRCRWNDFLKNSKNGHFFFDRDFLSYHEGRFEDFSLLFFDEKERLIALLPANIEGDRLYSHQGLTYGGLIVNDNMKMATMLQIFERLGSYLQEQGIARLLYKAVPHFHHIRPAEEDRYALWRVGATLTQREAGAVIDLSRPLKYSNGRKWSLKKAATQAFRIEESSDFGRFWELLHQILKQQHGAAPVHSLDEIRLLRERFPGHIRLFHLLEEDRLLAGAVCFDNPTVRHLQYVANSNEGRKRGALDLLIDPLIRESIGKRRYFDFGTSNREGGRVLNEGLIDQKERFGARVVVNDRYEWRIS